MTFAVRFEKTMREVSMPALSSTMTEGKVVTWKKQVGDRVEKGDTLLVVESDKADMDVESFESGYLAQILVDAGATSAVGAAIGLIAKDEAELSIAQKNPVKLAPVAQVAVTAADPVSAAPPKITTPAPASSGRIVASPRARAVAKELGIDLSVIATVSGRGRIEEADVRAAATAPVIPAATTKPAVVPPIVSGEIAALSTLQQALVRNMEASLQVPSFRVGYTITTDNLDRLYQKIKAKGVTMTTLLVKAVANTLKRHPLVNNAYTPQGIHQNQQINVAVAVAMDDGGLITPVLRQADQKDVYQLSREWKDLVARARTRSLKPEEYNTGTFTISNLGMFGVDRFDAIVPAGTGGILAVGAALAQVVVLEDGVSFGIRKQMQVNLTGDHRVFYGAHAAQFLKDLALLVEKDPQQLTL
ncbi:dihydrolipoamide acetyltransferase family protein [Anthocerotibacter panamensis]|uniref:dihydrolipoamide acetyltransferase family protein n=1 Tax=Anthocerotibacter panamensis TaxID=2857077 RepID=UPI001FD9509E|nr:dihydrolipoamide acetyltransferase family protein [Anthocerotibacter panamensis]